MSFSGLKKRINTHLTASEIDLVIKNANALNVFTEQFELCDIAISDGYIVGLGNYSAEREIDMGGKYIAPGFIDGHVHIESSLVSPEQYCRAAVPHGTTAVVADPHEIVNVLGTRGYDYMLSATEGLPLDVYFMVPSCVPATPFDESGAVLGREEVYELLSRERTLGLAEMMNYPGVLSCDDGVLAKLKAAQDMDKIIDGHAPGLSGRELNAYIGAGISSEHECTVIDEAIEKLSRGQWIMIREGTASKNLSELMPLFERPYCYRCMPVTDDKHAGALMHEGHIDHIIRRAIALGAEPVIAYKMASYNAACYFGLRHNGAIAPGYFADFVVLDNVNEVRIHSVYKRGQRVDDGLDNACAMSQSKRQKENAYENTIHIKAVTKESFRLNKPQEKVIGLVPGLILTTDEGYASEIDINSDICKLSVVERHNYTGNIGTAFMKGYGLRRGAVATSVAHDSHNIIVAGANDADMAAAVMRLRDIGGGMVAVFEGRVLAELALPIGGLMCELGADECENRLSLLRDAARGLGVGENIDPFMTLSFVSLPVIPALRLTTHGVVDVNAFRLL